MTVSIRRAGPDDVDFLVELVTHEDVEPFLAVVRAKGASEILGEIERSEREPEAFGVFVIEVDGAARRNDALRAGQPPQPDRRSRRPRRPSRLPRPQGRRRRGPPVSTPPLDELGFHRLEMEIYAFNERAMAHAERAGFVHEGVRRKAYWRNDQWVDGVLYGLVVDDVEGRVAVAVDAMSNDEGRANPASIGPALQPAVRRDRRGRRA